MIKLNKKDNYPWYKFYRDVPRHLEYPDGSMVEIIASTALKYNILIISVLIKNLWKK